MGTYILFFFFAAIVNFRGILLHACTAVASETGGAGGARAPPLFREEGQSLLTLELF